MPPEKRGFTSNTVPLVVVPLELDVGRAPDLESFRDTHAQIDQRRIVPRLPAIGNPGAHHQPFPRHHADDPAVEIREHIDGEFAALEKLLDDRIRHIIQKKPEFPLIGYVVAADASPALSRFEKKRVVEAAEIQLVRQPGARHGNAFAGQESAPSDACRCR